MYNSLGEYDKALECYERALKTHQALGEHSSIALVTGNIGIVYSSLGRYDTALDYYTQACTMHEQLGDKSEIAIVTGNIGSLYAAPDYDGYNPLVAHDYLQKAIELCLTISAKGSCSSISINHRQNCTNTKGNGNLRLYRIKNTGN